MGLYVWIVEVLDEGKWYPQQLAFTRTEAIAHKREMIAEQIEDDVWKGCRFRIRKYVTSRMYVVPGYGTGRGGECATQNAPGGPR